MGADGGAGRRAVYAGMAAGKAFANANKAVASSAIKAKKKFLLEEKKLRTGEGEYAAREVKRKERTDSCRGVFLPAQFKAWTRGQHNSQHGSNQLNKK